MEDTCQIIVTILNLNFTIPRGKTFLSKYYVYVEMNMIKLAAICIPANLKFST